jgi:hypothetical protein
MEFQVAKISEETANRIRGVEYQDGCFFNPIRNQGIYLITIAEAEFLSTSEYELYNYKIEET